MSAKAWIGLGALILVALVIPMVWLVVAPRLGTPINSTDQLAALGGIMAAVFTVGGLLIALAAVLTQLTLAERAQQLLENKYQTDLVPRFQRLMADRINAEFHWREAQQLMAPRSQGTPGSCCKKHCQVSGNRSMAWRVRQSPCIPICRRYIAASVWPSLKGPLSTSSPGDVGSTLKTTYLFGAV